MATLEKSKQKKKKKVRRSTEVAEESEQTQWSNEDIEFPSTSTSDEIEIISQPADDETICKLLSALPIPSETVHSPIENDESAIAHTISEFTAHGAEENADKSKSQDSTEKIEETITEGVSTETTEIIAPSAPCFEDLEPPQTDQPLQKLLYPNVQMLQSIDLDAKQATKQRIILQPFTYEQLKELYNNPELLVAEAFEADFINTELNNTHKDHALYELIKKYSHSRYNLKVNMLDLHGYIKCFQENSQKVWIIENRITTYEGICADGERIRKNELYEYAVLNEQTFQKLSSNLNKRIQPEHIYIDYIFKFIGTK